MSINQENPVSWCAASPRTEASTTNSHAKEHVLIPIERTKGIIFSKIDTEEGRAKRPMRT
jgi:hypothetical protein